MQQWSQGQCNIVDHRKLVSVNNNDKNKQRWVHFGDERQQVEVGFSYSSEGFTGPKTWKKPSELPESISIHGGFARVKKMESRTFVPLSQFSSVPQGACRCTEDVRYRGCDCNRTVTRSSVPICWPLQAESVYNKKKHCNIKPWEDLTYKLR